MAQNFQRRPAAVAAFGGGAQQKWLSSSRPQNARNGVNGGGQTTNRFKVSAGRLKPQFQSSSINTFFNQLDESLKRQPPKDLKLLSVCSDATPSATDGNFQHTNDNSQNTNGFQHTNGSTQYCNGNSQYSNGNSQHTNGDLQNTNGDLQHTNCTTSPLSSDFRDRLWDLRLRNVGNDFELEVGGLSFPVSKMILICGSEYFAQNLTADPELNYHALNGFDASIIELLLEFIYRGRLDNLEQKVELLYGPACDLQISELVTACVEILKQKLSEENMLDFGFEAKRYQEPQLLQAVVEFMGQSKERLYNVCFSPKFAQIATRGGQDAQQIMELMREARELLR